MKHISSRHSTSDRARAEFRSARPYDGKLIEKLQEMGYKYFIVKGYAVDNRPTYLEPAYILLTPIRELSINGRDSEIYEPIGSPRIDGWANSDYKTKIFIVTK